MYIIETVYTKLLIVYPLLLCECVLFSIYSIHILPCYDIDLYNKR